MVLDEKIGRYLGQDGFAAPACPQFDATRPGRAYPEPVALGFPRLARLVRRLQFWK